MRSDNVLGNVEAVDGGTSDRRKSFGKGTGKPGPLFSKRNAKNSAARFDSL